MSAVKADRRHQVEAWNDARKGRHFGKQRRSTTTIVRQQSDLPAFNSGLEAWVRGPKDLDMTTQQRWYGLARAAIRDMRYLEAQCGLHCLHCKLMGASDAGRTIVQFAGVYLRVVDELLKCFHRSIRGDRKKQRRAAQRSDWYQILLRVVR